MTASAGRGWTDAPADVRRQVEGFVRAQADALAGLVGVTLHGSLAMGCFNPDRSDVDLLVIVDGLTGAERTAVARDVLERSGSPARLEMHYLTTGSLDPWTHPAPFAFHYSADYRESFATGVGSSEWDLWDDPRDHDLAAHVAIARRRGVALAGPPPDELFPQVPQEDYRDAILNDLAWALDGGTDDPVYLALNATRVAAFLDDGRVLSKAEGATWALDEEAFPTHRDAIERALAVYRSVGGGGDPEPAAARELARAVLERA